MTAVFLEKVSSVMREELSRRKSRVSLEEWKRRAASLPPPRDFRGALEESGPFAVIAEIKRASPSAGMIRQEADLGRQAREYQTGGACAVSVLTESRFFGGDLGHLALVREAVSLPLLQKDFIIDPYQAYEGRAAGADAQLLIAALLAKDRLRELVLLIRGLSMAPLVEIHGEEDLEKIEGLDLPFLGINNRDLKSLKVDLATTTSLIPRIPAGIRVISESGIRTAGDAARLREAGVRGVLVGEALMRSDDPAARIREFMNFEPAPKGEENKWPKGLCGERDEHG